MNKKLKIALILLLSLMMIFVVYSSTTLQATLDTSFNTGRTVSNIGFEDFIVDSKGRLWGFKVRSNYVTTLEGDSWIVYRPPASDAPPAIFDSLTSDKNGNIWIGTILEGLIKFDGTNWTVFTTQNSGLVIDWTENLYADNEGRIWIAYGAYHTSGPGSGVTVFDGTTWTTYNTSNSGLARDFVSAIAFDSKNRAWFGTSAGLSVFDGEQWITYTSSNSGLASDNISCIAFDQDGRAWIVLNEGINIFDGEQWEFINGSDVGSDIYFYEGCHILFDQLERAWVAGYGVHILDKGTWISLLESDGSEASGNHIAMDAQGDIYISTYYKLVKLARDYPLDSVQQSRQIRAFIARGSIVFIEMILAGLILAILLESFTLALVWEIGNLVIFWLSPIVILPNDDLDYRWMGIPIRIWVPMVCAAIGAIVGAFVGTRKARHSQRPSRTKYEVLFIGLIGGYVVGFIPYFIIAIILYAH